MSSAWLRTPPASLDGVLNVLVERDRPLTIFGRPQVATHKRRTETPRDHEHLDQLLLRRPLAGVEAG